MRPPGLFRPTAVPLAPDEWSRRHRLLLLLLIGQGAVVTLLVAALNRSAVEALLHVGPLIAAALVAGSARSPRAVRECAMALGLFTVSATVVHLTDGAPAAHFHYFVMLIALAQYESARPFALGVAYVVVQHAIMGSLLPHTVFGMAGDHGDSVGQALVHGGFILAAAAFLGLNWRSNAASRTRAEQASRRAQEYLDIAGALLVGVDAAGRVTTLNPRAREVLGLDERAIGADWFEVAVPPEARELGRRTYAEFLARASDEPLELEYLNLTAGDGRVRVAWHIRLTRDERGRPTGSLSSGEDVTERVAGQRALTRERDDLAALRRLAHEVAARADAREAVTDGVAELVGAPIVVLAEASPDRARLHLTTVHGCPGLVGRSVEVGREPSALAAVLLSGERLHVDDELRPVIASPWLVEATGMNAMDVMPVRVDGTVVAVLAAIWNDPRDAPAAHATELLEVAADEAAVALGRLAMVRRLEEAALTDPLTGVANRRVWDDELPRELQRAARTGAPLTVVLLDLNQFKALNDRDGHEAGDRMLRAASAAWLDQLRTTDVLTRLGGDEFGILLPDCGAEEAVRVVRRLRRATPHRDGCGLGFAVWDGQESGVELVRRADRGLYEDKARSMGDAIVDVGRLAAVKATGLHDGGHSDELDRLAQTTCWMLEVPTAMVTLVTDAKQVFPGMCGLGGWAGADRATPLSHSFCQHAVATGRPLVVDDARDHPLVRDNPAIADLGVVAYAGMPITDADGNQLGVLCAIDTVPRRWSSDDLATLRTLAARASRHLAQRATA